ncbi:MAG: SatD, partial [Firmicutes bacterium]|nr:SatD [Bacillota bacterium]
KYAWQMDGSAFHYSRAALEEMKSRRKAATRFAGERADIWAAVNAFYTLIDTIQDRWSAKQWQAVDAYERAGTYAAAAAELGISPQNVAKRCQAAGWKAVAEAERFLSAYVKEGMR